VINTPRRKIGGKTIADLQAVSTNENLPAGKVVLSLAAGEDNEYFGAFSASAARALAGFGRLLAQWNTASTQLTPLELLDTVLEKTDYQSYINDGTEEGRDRWENVLELRRLAAEYQDKNLSEFLEEIALVSDQDTVDSAGNAPTLLTLHASKGLEFPVVFIIGLEDGTLPHSRSFDDPEAMAEERRLFYVGITRAKYKLFLTHALNRRTYGYSEPSDPSRFLDDLPEDLIKGGNPWQTLHGTRGSAARAAADWDRPTQVSAPVLTPEFSAGQTVSHPTWGEGMVLNSKIDDGEEIVEVFFEDLGLKKLVASLANLTVVK
jgi:DNA helicase-2/ATP-dependent DNA helicase PcrA